MENLNQTPEQLLYGKFFQFCFHPDKENFEEAKNLIEKDCDIFENYIKSYENDQRIGKIKGFLMLKNLLENIKKVGLENGLKQFEESLENNFFARISKIKTSLVKVLKK